MILRQIYNRIVDAFDPELRDVAAIINNAPVQDAFIHECDDVFRLRLKVNTRALKLSFWENHFEWRALSQYPEIKGNVLDFGCGSGHSDIFLARNGYNVHGLDLSPIGIKIANYFKEKEDASVQARLTFSRVDVTEVREQCELYDSAWSSHVFEHISDPAPVLQGLKQWLKPGAYLLISVPLGFAYDDPGHVNHFATGDQLREFLHGYIVVERVDVSEEYHVIRALCHFV